MSIMDWAAWSVIFGLSFISVGGLLLWAYGDSIKLWNDRGKQDDAGTVTARKQFTGVLMYSVVMIVAGLGCLVQGTIFVLQ